MLNNSVLAASQAPKVSHSALGGKPRCLFILKNRASGPYGSWNYDETATEGSTSKLTSGLTVSATQVVAMLMSAGIDVKLVHVVDNNSIDMEVTKFKPTHVFIEAFWVVPEKFDVLERLHPSVTWIVRNHSKTDFLAMEGNMIGWGLDYLTKGVFLGCNSQEADSDFTKLAYSASSSGERANPDLVRYLPNYYVLPNRPTLSFWELLKAGILRRFSPGSFTKSVLKIGCFGAIRPLKNHVNQAVAAILAADDLGVRLEFSINANRVEGNANSILTALRALFKRYPQHSLVEVPWMNHKAFMEVVGDMDVVCQVSNSETFNIVLADAVASGVPVIGSAEIPWLVSQEFIAVPNDVLDIKSKILNVVKHSSESGKAAICSEQFSGLQNYVQTSKQIWLKFLRTTSF